MILTKKKAIGISIELWTWLAETGEGKHEWPKWGEYGKMKMGCPLCEYDIHHPTKDRTRCNCPLDKFHSGCTGGKFSFTKWCFATTKEDRKKYAKEFLEQLKTL